MRPDIALIGHPFAPIGMGEHVRCSYRALRSVGRRPALVDLYGMSDAVESGTEEFLPAASVELGRINVFHINADEVDLALATLGDRIPADAYNIIYPAWELASFPDAWLPAIERFHEAWAPSAFIADALRDKASLPVVEMPLATEVVLDRLLSRRYFGIPEDAYVFLFFYDFRSYASRKNPGAVIEAFGAAVGARPFERTHLVIKTHGGDDIAAAELRAACADLPGRVTVLDRTMTDNEVKNLVRSTDAFVSLHRSEGFGRGMAEAMYLGKPVIATGYSGNMTFMTDDNSRPLPFSLVALDEGSYPFWQGQVWADVDVDAAVAAMVALVDDPDGGRRLGARASLDIRRQLSYRAVGGRFVERIDQLALEHAMPSPLAGIG